MHDPHVASALLATGLYWEIEAGAPEWVWVVSRMIQEYCPPPTNGDLDPGSLPEHALFFKDRTPVYLIMKSKVPFSVLFDRLGMREGASEEQARRIVLKPLAEREDLPQPTVDYWGTA